MSDFTVNREKAEEMAKLIRAALDGYEFKIYELLTAVGIVIIDIALKEKNEPKIVMET